MFICAYKALISKGKECNSNNKQYAAISKWSEQTWDIIIGGYIIFIIIIIIIIIMCICFFYFALTKNSSRVFSLSSSFRALLVFLLLSFSCSLLRARNSNFNSFYTLISKLALLSEHDFKIIRVKNKRRRKRKRKIVWVRERKKEEKTNQSSRKNER